jgi:hypothetical protein
VKLPPIFADKYKNMTETTSTSVISGSNSNVDYSRQIDIDDKIRASYGTEGEKILETIYAGLQKYNYGHQTKVGLAVIQDSAGKRCLRLINTPPNFRTADITAFFTGKLFNGYTPQAKSDKGIYIIKFEPELSSIYQDESRHRTPRQKGLWQEEPMYKPDFFKNNPDIYHRTGKKHLLGVLLTLIKPNDTKISHYFTLPIGLSFDFKPIGRIGEFLKRDEKFYENARSELVALRNPKKTLFLNFTGHSGSVAAALAEKGIPIYWQMRGNERTINSLQDWIGKITANTKSNKTCAGLMLEPSHGAKDDVAVSIATLPTAADLQRMGLTTVIVFSENIFGRLHTVDSLVTASDAAFINYLRGLETNGVKVQVSGLD